MADHVERPTQRRALVVIDAALALMAVVLLVQMWLLSSTLETYLEGHTGAAVPGAIASGVLFTVCVGLFLLVVRADRNARRR